MHGIGIFDYPKKKKKILTTEKRVVDTIYTPNGVVLFGCYLHFIHSKPNIKLKICIKKKNKYFENGGTLIWDSHLVYLFKKKNELIHFSSDSQVIYCQRNSIFNFYFAFNFSLDENRFDRKSFG